MCQLMMVKEVFFYMFSVFFICGSLIIYDVVIICGFIILMIVNINQYLDGMKLQGNNYFEVFMDFYFFECVEVMCGLILVLYGNSNLGGIVSMVSKCLIIELLKEVQFKMGIDNLWQIGFDFSDVIDDVGVWLYCLIGFGCSQDVQQQMVKLICYVVVFFFSWCLDDKIDFIFLSNFQNDLDVGYYGWLLCEGIVVLYYDVNGKVYKLLIDFNEGEFDNKIFCCQKMVGYSFFYQFDDIFIVWQNLCYVDVYMFYCLVYGNGYVVLGYMNCVYVCFDEYLNIFIVDIQLQFDFVIGVVSYMLLIGVDYLWMCNDVDVDYGMVDFISMSNLQYGNLNIQVIFLYVVFNWMEQIGLYVQDQMEWDKWVMILGGCYDYVMILMLICVINSLVENYDQQFSWCGGINYLFDNGIFLYFSYSELFELVLGFNSCGQLFDLLCGKQYEVGVKYVLKDMLVVVIVVVYQLIKDKNLMVDLVNQVFSIQIGEICFCGFELEVKVVVNVNINVIVVYSYIDVEYIYDMVFNGKCLVEVLCNMVFLWVDYIFYEIVLSGLMIGVGVCYIGLMVSYYKNDISIGKKNDVFSVVGYVLMDVMVKYDLVCFGLLGLLVGVNVNNLFDCEYVFSCYSEYVCYWGVGCQVVVIVIFCY